MTMPETMALDVDRRFQRQISMAKRRFTILKHFTGYSVHLDFLMETEKEELSTWQIENIVPFEQKPAFFSVRAKKIFSHRKIYLDYEGEISKNRGVVSRLDSGMYLVLKENEKNRFYIQTEGTHFSGNWKFLHLQEDIWMIYWSESLFFDFFDF